MATNNVHTLTEENFEREVVQSELPVLVDVWADWCQPCRMLSPTIDELADEYAGRVKVGKVDTDANPNLSMKLGVTAVPTVLIYRDGKVVKKFTGLLPKRDFAAELDKVA